MTDISEIISFSISINNDVKIKNLSEISIDKLHNLIVWDKMTPDNKLMTFGNSYFRPIYNERAVIIKTGSVLFDYEIKAIMIISFHLGFVEGGNPLKWKSVLNRVRLLIRFCMFLQSYGYKSFRGLNDVPELMLMNLINDFLYLPKSKGGMEQEVFTTSAKTMREGLLTLSSCFLVEKEPLSKIIHEITINKISKHENENRLKHSIIPMNIMKDLIKDSTNYIEDLKKNSNNIFNVYLNSNKGIKPTNFKNYRNVLEVHNKINKNEISKAHAFISKLNLHTYTLILAFTGMRDNEVYELKNYSHSFRLETDEKIYTLNSKLSNTTEGTICLDWVSNSIVYDAVDLLSKVNDIYRDRAKLLLKYYRDSMPDNDIKNYERGLKNNRLFGIRHTKHTVRFIDASRSSDEDSSIFLNRHTYQVTASDIEQLEKMNCNYQSISQISGKRGLKYNVGDFFNFTAHQFRHTFAWFIIANRLGDLDDIKYQFKHLNSVMTFIYAERGYESLSELRVIIEYFEEKVNEQAIVDIVDSAKKGNIGGGGGDRLAKFIAKLNEVQSEAVFSTGQQPHFNNTQELIEFTTRHSDSVRGLPHGYCTKGLGCKIKNASDPSHCLYCDTYYSTPKHLPYWQAIKHSCEEKIERISSLPDTSRYQTFLTGLKDNLIAANEIIDRLVVANGNNKRTS
jgi:hypothetical protein